MHKKIKLTRKELFSAIWEHPRTYFTEKYMVSYASFKRICERNEIPLPPNGYWSKKKYGKEIEKPRLNSIDNETNIELYLRPEGDHRDFGDLTEMDQKILEIEADSRTNFSIPEKLSNMLDPVLIHTKKWYNKDVKVPEDLDYYARYYPGPIRCYISKKQLSRALLLFNVLLKNLNARGHELTFGRYNSFVKLYGIEIEISISEKNKRIKIPGKYGEEYKSEPTGMLAINTGEYYYSKTWNDAKTIKLENKLSAIIAWLEIEAEAERQREIESKKREEEEKEKERLEKERQILIDNEINLLQDLRQKSELWNEANKLRKFLYEYEAQLEKDDQLTKENIELLHFGFQKVDWLDPLIQTDDELFSDIDPFKLLKLWK
ncbi:hypothetical protein [Christiangramia sp. OXR-203]|uniref:hypothetical protein n=1 Tax=Christiangramia sp. OXR-203 TaxID=3100176 RepID=UPI002AC9D626|nr:hypothetical protein [Christiangramia sp. OXR-203]WPY99851.1 hypothetical protein T8I65_06455 [Christiangramia sp. OXR-203]